MNDDERKKQVFARAANLILDSVEDVFKIVAPNGRDRCVAAIISVLEFYTTAKSMDQLLQAEKEYLEKRRDI